MHNKKLCIICISVYHISYIVSIYHNCIVNMYLYIYVRLTPASHPTNSNLFAFQKRSRICVPLPQVLEQMPHSFHSLTCREKKLRRLWEIQLSHLLITNLFLIFSEIFVEWLKSLRHRNLRWKPKMMLILSSLAPPLFLEQLPGIRLSFCRAHLDLLCVSFVSKGTRSFIPSKEFHSFCTLISYAHQLMKWIQIQRGQQTNKKKQPNSVPFHFPSRKTKQENKTPELHPEKSLQKSKTQIFFAPRNACHHRVIRCILAILPTVLGTPGPWGLVHRRSPSLKLTASLHLKMDGVGILLSVWGPAYFL